MTVGTHDYVFSGPSTGQHTLALADLKLQERLNDPEYKNWLKIGLALRHTRDGLGGFTDKYSKRFHSRLLEKNHDVKCGECRFQDIKK